ncbi:MAG: hypothetical protein ABI634_17545 [Acidobacteriota bacterium]
MRTTVFAIAVILSASAAAQEPKPVPKDSVRVFIPGCTKGYMFTAGPRAEDQPGRSNIPEGMHLRMNAPKKTIAELKKYEGSMIEITGLIRRNDLVQDGIGIGPLRVSPGPTMSGGGSLPAPGAGQVVIDLEGFRRVPGDCPR